MMLLPLLLLLLLLSNNSLKIDETELQKHHPQEDRSLRFNSSPFNSMQLRVPASSGYINEHGTIQGGVN